MERLTSRNEDCVLVNGHALGCATVGEIVQMADRLADYEDAGLTPAEVLSMHSEWSAMMSVLNSIGSYGRLRELAEADRDGRVLILPCKRGDELWAYGAFQHGMEVYKVAVSDVSTLNGRTVLNTYGFGTIRPEDIGKTVFLSREEAEKALQEMEGKKDG